MKKKMNETGETGIISKATARVCLGLLGQVQLKVTDEKASEAWTRLSAARDELLAVLNGDMHNDSNDG